MSAAGDHQRMTTRTNTSQKEGQHMTILPRINGNCPMGCGATLFLAVGGYVTCSYLGCPNPTAVDDILAEKETEHIVTIHDDNFSILHPLRERLGSQLDDCALHAYMSGLSGPPARPGKYRATEITSTKKPAGLSYAWEPLS